MLGLSPKLKEMHQRHSLYYHTPNYPSAEQQAAHRLHRG